MRREIRAVAFALSAAALSATRGGALAGDDAPPEPKALVENLNDHKLGHLAVSGDGRLLAVDYSDAIRILDTTKGTKVCDVKTDSSVEMAFCGDADRDLVVRYFGQGVTVWRSTTGAKRYVVAPPAVKDAERAPDKDPWQSPAVARNAAVFDLIWPHVPGIATHDGATGKAKATLRFPVPLPPSARDVEQEDLAVFSEIAGSSDGRTVLAFGSSVSRNVDVVRVYRRSAAGADLAFVASIDDRTKVATKIPQLIRPLVSDDGAFVVRVQTTKQAGGEKKTGASVTRCCRVEDCELVWEYPAATDWGYAATAGDVVALADDTGVEILDLKTGKKRMRLTTGEDRVFGMALAPKASRVFASTISGRILVWDLAAPPPQGK